jgi:hypothetical protein
MKRFIKSCALALAGVLALCASDAQAQQISRDGDDFQIKAATYSARISGKTGLLESMTIDDVKAVESTAIDLERRLFTSIAVSQESPTVVTTTIAADDKGRGTTPKIIEKALRISYEARPDTLVIRVLATLGRVAGRGMRFQIGKEAQMVRALDFKETVPLPVLQMRSPWMRVKYYFSNGATLGILNQGAGNPFNANENGRVAGYEYSRGGYVANSEYTYTLIAEKAEKPVAAPLLGSPAMQILEAKTPAVFWQPDVPTATLQISKANYQKLLGRSGLKIKYTVLDAFDAEVAKGETPLDLSSGADPLEIKIALPVKKLGWYRAYFSVNDDKSTLLESSERLIFSVLKPMPNMGQSFQNQMQTNYTIGLGFSRIGIPAKIVDAEKVVTNAAKSAEGTDVLVSYQIDDPPREVGNDPQKFGQYTFDLFTQLGDRIPSIEIINEPNGRLEPKFYIETFLRPAYENIKKASPKTKVLGPVLVGISNDAARFLSELYKLGLKDVTDELTFHPYAGNFDDGNAVRDMQRLQQIIAANGDANKPVFFTEAGYSHGGWSDPSRLREVIKLLISQYAWQDSVMGIDYRHNLYYFTDSMGYYDFWLRSTQLTPAAVAMRNYTGLVKGQGRAQRLSFGSRENVRAFLYPGKDKQVVLLWTSSNRDESTTQNVTFTTGAKSVQWLDCFGNALDAKIENGKLTLAMPTFPTYLVLGAQDKIAPVAENWGANLALTTLGATAEATSEEGTQPAVSAIDGSETSQSNWRSLTPNQLPQTLTITLAGPSQINRAGLWSYNARGYDLEARDATGQWKKLVSKRDQPLRRFREETFPTVTSDQFRLTVVDSFSDRADVAELQLFSPSTREGAAPDLINWAAKEKGATARASSELSKEVTIAEQAYGAKEAVITKTKLEAKAENAIDGKRLISGWRDFFPTTWMAARGSTLPQWLEITFAEPKKISSVAVYTIAFQSWAPQTSGIRDWQVQAWQDGEWKTIDTIAGNQKVSQVSRFATAITTDKIRIWVTATNDEEGNVGIMEVQAFGPAK